jgi:pimeloyl-ACP methyl ester carboxylesterase
VPLREVRHAGWTFDVVDDGPRDADCMVLLHGFPSGARCWDGVTSALGGGFRTLALDQRGYSPQARPHDVRAYAVGELTGDVLALADAADADRFHLVGHDWGGLVAWHLAAHHSHRLRSLTVLSTPHPRALVESMSRSWQPLRSAYAVAWQVPVVPETVMLAADGRLLRAGLEASRLDASTAEHYVNHMRQPGALRSALNWYRAAGRTPGPLFSLPSVDVPTLFVWSTNDQALGRTAAERTARHVEGRYRFEVLEGVSHWIPETEPSRVATLIRQHALAQR